jgi:hypothetical protein
MTYRLYILLWLAFASVVSGQVEHSFLITHNTTVNGKIAVTSTCGDNTKPSCDVECVDNQLRLKVCPNGNDWFNGCATPSNTSALIPGPIVYGFGCPSFSYRSVVNNSSSKVVNCGAGCQFYGVPRECCSWQCDITYNCLFTINSSYTGGSDYSNSNPGDCAINEALAQGLVEARKDECTEGGGVFQNSNIVESQGGYCVSGSCNDCSSDKNVEILTDIFISHTDDCCSLGMEPDFDFDYKDFCMSPLPAENGIAYPSVNRNLALKCSDAAAGSGKNYCDRPPSSSSYDSNSSSSEEEDSSSSSSDDKPSSSSAACYASFAGALADVARLREECWANGDEPDYYADSDYCIRGGCNPKWLMSSSSGSGGGGDQCLAPSMRLLQKNVDDYDDGWVYMGKETYGSKKVSMMQKYFEKYVDALGRLYDKVIGMGRKIYYPAKPVPVEEVKFEFDVWARVIKDADGNDVKMFIKEDKRRGVRKDSSFYYDGYWEVMETDEKARTIKSKTSLGVSIVSSHDEKWRVTSDVMTNKYNDTITHDIYFWKNGRLVKTIFNGIERVFVYGKTLQDTVKVIPSDDGIYFHPGYNNTTGMIPAENDPEYAFFARGPYAAYFVKRGIPALLRYYELDPRKIDIGYTVIYENPTLINAIDKNVVYPKGRSGGESTFDADINSESKCIYKDGCYHLEFKAKMADEAITLFQSHLKYDNGNKRWQRYCRTSEQLSTTYDHEKHHVNNARNTLYEYSKKVMKPRPPSTNFFSTRNECETEMIAKKIEFNILWKLWKQREADHCNGVGNLRGDCPGGEDDPRSPAMSLFIFGEPCDDDMH